MPKVPCPGHYHRDAVVVGGLDDFVVAHRAARLNDSGGAGFDRDRRPSANGKKASEATTDPLVAGSARPAALAASSALRAAIARSRCGSSGRRRCRRSPNPWRKRWCSTSHAWRLGRQSADRAVRRWSAPAWSQVGAPSLRPPRGRAVAAGGHAADHLRVNSLARGSGGRRRSASGDFSSRRRWLWLPRRRRARR